MMTETMTWRTFFDDFCRRMKADEKKAFLSALGVSKVSMNRWRRGTYYPEPEHLKRILSFFSEGQKQQFLLLLRYDAKGWSLLPADIQNMYPLALQQDGNGQIAQFQLGLLDHFSLKMLRLQRETPDRFWQISSAVLREALSHLETHPEQTGLQISIATCMPPNKDGKIRSLRARVGMGTPPWRSDFHSKDSLLGANDLEGQAVMKRHGEMIPDFDGTESHLPIPLHAIEQAQSAAAFPILRENCVAGALLLSSTQPRYFTQERMALIEIFADLIRLAFYDGEFYPVSRIDLGLMPAPAVQRVHFASFGQQVEQAYQQLLRNDAPLRDLTKVEDQVRSRMEDELLSIAGHHTVFCVRGSSQ